MNNRKNIVVIMYNFPPIGAGRGIAWTYIADKLAENYKVHVITITPSTSDPIYNESKLEMINKTYNVYRTNPGLFYHSIYPAKSNKRSDEVINKRESGKIIKAFKKVYKKIIRSMIFPDRMVFWNKYAYDEFKKIQAEKNIDLLITVGFPFSTHILGNRIKHKFGGKLILDYGDPWAFNPSNETTPNWRKPLDYFIEKKIIRNADFITVTTKKTAEEYKKRFKISEKIGIIPQGADTEKYNYEIVDSENNLDNINNRKKEICLFYSGIFYEDIRNPREFFKGLSLLKLSDFQGLKLKIIIAGKMENYVLDYVNKLNFSDSIKIEFIGNISLEEVIRLQVNCDGLLYFGNKGNLQVPGKLYEYIAARRPIFAIAPVYDEACEIIDNLKRGVVVQDDAVIIKNKLIEFIFKYKLNCQSWNLREIVDYDWKEISSKYEQIVDSILRSGLND